MIRPHQVLAICFICLLPLCSFAEAPVVDDSENFAMLEEQQAANELPVNKTQNKYSETEEEMALAQDNSTEVGETNDLLAKIKGMQQEIQELRGQLEVQGHELKQLQQQLSYYKDIDARFKNSTPAYKQASSPSANNENEILTNSLANELKTKTAASGIKTAATNLPPITIPVKKNVRSNNPADEQISYLAAYELVKNKRYDEALTAMKNFASNYPNSGYTANAQYWLGELYMVQKNYPKAIDHFEHVLKNFSTSSKAAACSLKIGYALAASGRKEEAKIRLQQVVRNYPDTPTAQLALTKLMSINNVST